MLVGGAAAAAAAGGSLFEYNRQNFMYDRKMRQETEYQIMDFRIKQAELWRDDVRDIIGLTSVKMDTYLIVNAVQLGFCVMAFCEGRLAAGTPVWLIGCHTLSLAGSFMYLLMSVWLAMHASVTAKSYEVRLLTQLVRLPVPSWAQLEGSRTYASGFEKVEPRQMFRVPFAMGTQEAALQAATPECEQLEARAAFSSESGPVAGPHQSETEDGPAAGAAGMADADLEAAAGAASRTGDVWGLEGRGDSIVELDGRLRADPRLQRHLRLVRHAMQYWQSYDGFARVALSCGTNQLVTALAYYVIGYVLISNHAVIACWLVVILFMVIAAALIRLDMSLTGLEYRISVVLVTSGPCLIAVAAEQWSRHTDVGYEVAHLLCPISYVVHAMWLMFLLYISNVREQKGGALLPTGFRSVMYIDVFGWINRQRPKRQYQANLASTMSPTTPVDASARTSGRGPAVQSLRYEQGQPVSSRPEELPGASQAPQPLEGLRREDLEPTTFVPREKEGSDYSNLTLQAHMRPGFVPWRIFCVATVLLILLWWISGVIMLLMSCGLDWFKVEPLLREPEESGTHAHVASLLQFPSSSHLPGGFEVATDWADPNAQPRSLSCSDSGGQLLLVSAGRFSWYTARALNDPTLRVEFRAAQPCLAVEGQELQDVALDCSTRGCRALLLHGGGTRLASCPLAAERSTGERLGAHPEQSLPFSLLSDAPEPGAEAAATLALSPSSCPASTQCSIVETSKRRIVEMRLSSRESGRGAPDWFPARTLSNVLHADDNEAHGDKLHPIGHYLGLFQPRQKLLKILDPHSAELLGEWRLPNEHQWSTMCSANNSLYFLTDSSAPKLWRFPVPPLARTWASATSTRTAQKPQKRKTQQSSLLTDRSL